MLSRPNRIIDWPNASISAKGPVRVVRGEHREGVERLPRKMLVSLGHLVPETRPVDRSEVELPAVYHGCLIQMRVHGGRKMRKRVADFGRNRLKCSVHGGRKMCKRVADFGCNRINCSVHGRRKMI